MMRSRLAIIWLLLVGGAALALGLFPRRPAEPARQAVATPVALAVAPTIVGMNVSPLAYWSGERPFADPVQSNAEFFIRRPGRDVEPLVDQVPTDIHGWPTSVPMDAMLIVSLQNFAPPRTGRYDCRVSPDWSVTGFADAQVVQRGTRFTLAITDGQWHVASLYLKPKRASAPLSKLACVPIDPAVADGPFARALVDDLRPFRVVRFMNWMRANGDPPTRWAARPSLQSRSQAEAKGVALEHLVDLATRLRADPWFTVPLADDDDYYRSFALYVRDHLPRDRRIYVEVSNEVWNAAFAQSREATRLGQVRYPSASAIEAADYFYADRVRAVMAIWDDVFGGEARQRLVRVLASQAVYAQRAENALAHDDTWRFVDALAIAPYFGEGVQAIEATGAARLRALAARGADYVDRAITAAHENKRVAARYRLPLIAYEAGPDFVGHNPVARADAEAWRQSPELIGLYRSYLDRWRREIGGLIVLFDSAGNDGYGHKLYSGQPIEQAPLMQLAVDFAQVKGRAKSAAP